MRSSCLHSHTPVRLAVVAQPVSAPEGEEAKPVGLTGVVPKLEDGGGTPAPPSGAAASASTAMVPMQQQAGGPPAQPGQGGQQPSAPQGGPQQSGGGGVVKDDVDVVEECEIFDTRSEFLDFCKVGMRSQHRPLEAECLGAGVRSDFPAALSVACRAQGNHYQFDELRRAKHTSMMVSSDPKAGVAVGSGADLPLHVCDPYPTLRCSTTS